MGRLAKFIRRHLARRGYLLHRISPGIPPSLVEHLGAKKSGAEFVVCFDTDAYVQAEILSVFPPERARFMPPPAADQPELTPASFAGMPFVVIVNPEIYDLAELAAARPWIFSADQIILRSTLGYFWTGVGDFVAIEHALASKGFSALDALDFSKPGLLNGLLGRVVLVFGKSPRSGPTPRSPRVQEAAAFLSRPIVSRENLTWLAGRGSFGCAAGVFNPGAVVDGDDIVLVVNGEKKTWVERKASETVFIESCTPTLLRVNPRGDVAATPLTIQREDNAAARLEDFRLLRFRGEIISNHVAITVPSAKPSVERAVEVPALTTRVTVSRISPHAGTLEVLGEPRLDVPLRQTEKNWAMFVRQDELFLIYSFSPYRVLRASSWPDLEFKTVVQANPKLPFASGGQSVRNSINPVDYDSAHWLHVVHMVYPTKQYVFWAVLIDKASLMPVKASRRPLAAGWHSSPASIIYACSVVLRATEVHLFAGLDDSATAKWTFPRAKLEAEWVSLESNPA